MANSSKATYRDRLQTLMVAHAELRTCLAEMEQLTLLPSASRSDFATARFRISNASLKRRAPFKAACEELIQTATAEAAKVIADLRLADSVWIKLSARHVRDWPAEAIEADWSGYCKASRAIRRHIANELDHVEQRLHPLLRLQSPQPRSPLHRAA